MTNINLRRALVLAGLTFAAASGARAEGPTMVGGGDDLVILRGPAANNVVGGALVRLSGGGDDMVATVDRVGAVGTGMALVLQGGGDDQRFVPVARPVLLAGPRASGG